MTPTWKRCRIGHTNRALPWHLKWVVMLRNRMASKEELRSQHRALVRLAKPKAALTPGPLVRHNL